MIKRFQIPSSVEDQKLYREAAKKQGVSAAEWARRILRREATQATQSQTLGGLLEEVAAYGKLPEIELPEREVPRDLEGWTK